MNRDVDSDVDSPRQWPGSSDSDSAALRLGPDGAAGALNASPAKARALAGQPSCNLPVTVNLAAEPQATVTGCQARVLAVRWPGAGQLS